jgi:hypothetical protein
MSAADVKRVLRGIAESITGTAHEGLADVLR